MIMIMDTLHKGENDDKDDDNNNDNGYPAQRRK
jgi:hypothetical protein